MRKILVILMVILAATSYGAVTGIEPDTTSRLDMSSIDVNRIVCPNKSSVTNFVHSEEKGLQLQPSGENLFVKFPVIETESAGRKEKVYYNGSAEVFLSCGSSVYSLILNAKRIPGQTVYLSDTASDMKKAAEYTVSKSYDELMLDLVGAIIHNTVPKGFKLADTDLQETYKDIQITAVKEISGGGFRVRELVLRSDKQVSITDTELIKLKMFKNVKAVAIMSPVFSGTTTAYVVEGVAR